MSVAVILSTALLVLMLILFLQFRYKKRHIIAAGNKLPCPTTLPIFGNALIFIGGAKTLRKTLISLTGQFKEVFCIWMGIVPAFVVSSPADVQVILNSSTTIDKDDTYKYLKPFLGNGLLLSPAPMWRKYRRLISPMLHPTTIENYQLMFNDVSRKMSDQFGKTPKIDPRYEIFCLSLDAALNALVGRPITLSEETKKNLHSLFDMIGRITSNQMFNVWLQIDWVFHLLYKKEATLALKESADLKKIYEQLVKEFSEEREAIEKSPNEPCEPEISFCYLSHTIPENANEDHTWWDEVVTVLIAASDTVISVMSFFLLTVAMHPDVQTRVRNEILEVMGDSNRDVTAQDIDSLTYLNQALMESMRLHGVAPFIMRRATKDTKLANTTLPAGSRIIIPLQAMGWDSDTFPEPHKYDPDRFSPENMSKRHKYSYIPFSAGPRNCIGKKYANILMRTVMVHVLRKFEVRTNMKMEDIEYEAKIVMYSKNPLNLEFFPF